MRNKIMAVTAIIGLVLVLSAGQASAWVGLTLRASANGCVSVTVTAENVETQVATVREGNLFAIGTTIPAAHYDSHHVLIPGKITKVVTRSGDYNVKVNYPGDHTLRETKITVKVERCPVEPCPPGTHQVGQTQSYPPHPICVPDEPTTTTSTVVKDTTTTTAGSTVTTEGKADVGIATSVTAVEIEPAFTG